MKYFFKHWQLYTFSLVGLTLLAGCAIIGLKVQSGASLRAGAKLAGRTSYRFLPNRAMAAAQAVSNLPYWYNQVGQQIAQDLAQKGYRQVQKAPSDFLIAYHIVIKRTELVTVLNNYVDYHLTDSQAAQAALSEFTKPRKPGEPANGTVIIDAVDPADHRLLWRGWAKITLTSNNYPNRLTPLIKLIVSRALAQFPPHS